MKKFKSFIKKWTGYFQKRLDILTKATKKERDDIKKLENKLQILNDSKDTPKEKETSPNIWTGKIMFRFWFTWLLVVFLGYLGFKGLNIIYLVFTALIISIAMEAVISFFARRINRWISIVLSYLLLVILILSWFFSIIPFLLDQIGHLLNITLESFKNMQESIVINGLDQFIQDIWRLPTYFKKLILSSLWDPEIVLSIQEKVLTNLSQMIDLWKQYASNIGNLAVGFFTGFLSFVKNSSIVLVLAVLFSIQKKQVILFMAQLWWTKKREYLEIKIKRIYKQLGIRLKSQLFLMVFIGVMMLVSLLILSAFGLDIPEKGSLALIAGLLEVIPYLWPTLGGFPAVIVVLIHNWPGAALIMIWIIVTIQRLENNILIPVLMKKTLWISPVIVFLSMLLWAILMWLIWVILAVPIAVILTLFWDDKFEK